MDEQLGPKNNSYTNQELKNLDKKIPNNYFTRDMADTLGSKLLDNKFKFKILDEISQRDIDDLYRRIPSIINKDAVAYRDREDYLNIALSTVVTENDELIFSSEQAVQMFIELDMKKGAFVDTIYDYIKSNYSKVIKQQTYINPHPTVENLTSRFLGREYSSEDYYDVKAELKANDAQVISGKMFGENFDLLVDELGTENVSYHGNSGEIKLYYGIPAKDADQDKIKQKDGNGKRYFGKFYMTHEVNGKVENVFSKEGYKMFKFNENNWKSNYNIADFFVRKMKENQVTDFKVIDKLSEENTKIITDFLEKIFNQFYKFGYNRPANQKELIDMMMDNGAQQAPGNIIGETAVEYKNMLIQFIADEQVKDTNVKFIYGMPLKSDKALDRGVMFGYVYIICSSKISGTVVMKRDAARMYDDNNQPRLDNSIKYFDRKIKTNKAIV